jgi:hypothetical protein
VISETGFKEMGDDEESLISVQYREFYVIFKPRRKRSFKNLKNEQKEF